MVRIGSCFLRDENFSACVEVDLSFQDNFFIAFQTLSNNHFVPFSLIRTSRCAVPQCYLADDKNNRFRQSHLNGSEGDDDRILDDGKDESCLTN